jgi:exodeoxyribonuclease VII large subunit
MNNEPCAIYTVSQLNNAARELLEQRFLHILVEGEISNFTTPVSGHWYFSLKDDKAQIRCAMFRGANLQLRFKPNEGMHVQVRAKVSLYAPRGDYQLIIEFMEERGEGALRQAFELLKRQLENEGLFAQEHKKNLPAFPRTIGVITSATGAAVHDIIKVLRRRCSGIPVIIYPSLVQGENAAQCVAKAIGLANQRAECDVLIVGRGGGSLEDLWAFNEAVVARAIFASSIPIVSAVGHESDVTIADFVADVRAPTPSAAAEIVSPHVRELEKTVYSISQRLSRAMSQYVITRKTSLTALRKQLRHPGQLLQENMQRLDFNWQNLTKSIHYFLQTKSQKLQHLSRALNAISPLATLDRGYAIVKNRDNHIIRNRNQVTPGERIYAQIQDGSLECIIENIRDAEK